MTDIRRSRVRAIMVGPALIAILCTSSGAMASSRSSGPRRVLGVGPDGTVSSEQLTADASRASASPARVVLSTVDTDPYTGYENAVYAADDNTVYVAYKRFTQNPSGGGYVPAELRVAKTGDGGRSWLAKVVDPNAIEEADTIDGSVSIDGADGAVYVAYHTRASGLFADMKLKVAKSLDGGATWSLTTVVDAGAGDYNSIRVISPSTVLISAHGAGSGEGVHAYVTTNGGASWTDSLVEGGLGNGYYTSVGATNLRTAFISYYNSLYPDHTDLNAARRVGQVWHAMVVDGTPGDQDLTGLGSSVWVAAGPTVWIAYEADTTQGTFVRVAKASTSDPTWTIVPVQQQPGIGVNTAVHSVGTNDVYVSYWASGSTAQAMFAVSSDGGATWAHFAIPETKYVQPYMDSTAPSTAVQFESYQIQNLSNGQTALKVAVVTS